ncbi:MAG: 2-polyprenyl-3-methyl-6-methoxy-1,4-benzoquinone monooxygenase [Burkholderiales bacterium]|nr:2-polyprenyl-3-methyl-6-methoxy-1,4-benzoquinone monooxygenase [Burkholderiales bacterium]
MLDKIILELDKIINNLSNHPVSTRPHPDEKIEDAILSQHEKRQIIGLMRVNHCGEICAQALYQGQAITAKDKSNQIAFHQAAEEEIEHLAWTSKRLEQLGGKPSKLNPLFYFSSLGIGVLAGLIGDKWNLAFLKETELQVEQHLAQHLEKLPDHDKKSIAIIKQMKIDENKHAQMAEKNGAAELPQAIKKMMQFSSKIMTRTTYHI